MAVNWKRGIKRAHYFVLAIIWIITIAINSSSGAASVGESIVYLLIFTLGYMAFFRAVEWVVAGFTSNP